MAKVGLSKVCVACWCDVNNTYKSQLTYIAAARWSGAFYYRQLHSFMLVVLLICTYVYLYIHLHVTLTGVITTYVVVGCCDWSFLPLSPLPYPPLPFYYLLVVLPDHNRPLRPEEYA